MRLRTAGMEAMIRAALPYALIFGLMAGCGYSLREHKNHLDNLQASANLLNVDVQRLEYELQRRRRETIDQPAKPLESYEI